MNCTFSAPDKVTVPTQRDILAAIELLRPFKKTELSHEPICFTLEERPADNKWSILPCVTYGVLIDPSFEKARLDNAFRDCLDSLEKEWFKWECHFAHLVSMGVCA